MHALPDVWGRFCLCVCERERELTCVCAGVYSTSAYALLNALQECG